MPKFAKSATFNVLNFVKSVFIKVKKLIVPTKLSDVQIKGKKAKFTKELALIKYEKQEIPLPRVTERKVKAEDKESYLDEQADIQKYYLFQFVSFEKNLQKKRIKELARKNVTEFISILHYLSYKKGTTLKTGSFSPTSYKVNVDSIEYTKNGKSRSR